MMPGGTLARARVVKAPHLLLKDEILMHRKDRRRDRERCVHAIFTLGIDWFHCRPPQ